MFTLFYGESIEKNRKGRRGRKGRKKQRKGMEGENTQINFWLRSCKQNRERNIQKKTNRFTYFKSTTKGPGRPLDCGKYAKIHEISQYRKVRRKKKTKKRIQIKKDIKTQRNNNN